jgi:hypothetical protein
MLCRGPSLAASLSAYLIDHIDANPRIEVRLESRVTAVSGNGRLEAVTINDADVMPTDAMFLALGGEPRTGWAARLNLLTDSAGYLLTGHDLLADPRFIATWSLHHPPHSLEASVPGIFVAGDVRHGSTTRVAGAVREGAAAVALDQPGPGTVELKRDDERAGRRERRRRPFIVTPPCRRGEPPAGQSDGRRRGGGAPVRPAEQARRVAARAEAVRLEPLDRTLA